MARALKPHKVREVTHDTLPIVADIMFDRNRLVFYGMIGSERIIEANDEREATFNGEGERGTFRSCDEAIKVAKAYIKTIALIQWESVIEVHLDTNDGHGGWYSRDSRDERQHQSATRMGLRFRIERFERAMFDGEWKLRRSHVLDCDEYWLERRKLNNAEGDRYHVDDDAIILPYTDETWQALGFMIGALHGFNNRITALFASKKSVESPAAFLNDIRALSLRFREALPARKRARRTR